MDSDIKLINDILNKYYLLILLCSLGLASAASAQPLPPEDVTIPYELFLPQVWTYPNFGPNETRIGLAYASINSRQPYEVAQLRADWFQVWTMGRTDYGTGLERVQHLSCDRRVFWEYGTAAVDQFEQAHMILGADFDGYLLFLNEPDLHIQCRTTPDQAAFMLRAVQDQFPNAIIVGPQPSHFDYWNNWVWMKEFYNWLDHYDIEPPDIAAIHNYVDDPQIAIVDSFFDNVLAQYPGAPMTVWVTEMGSGYYNVVQAMLVNCLEDRRIERCAYFTPRNTDVVWGSELYVGATAELTRAGHAWMDTLGTYGR